MTTRINPTTGVLEEGQPGLLAEVYVPKVNEDGNLVRIDPVSGVVEEGRSVVGVFTA